MLSVKFFVVHVQVRNSDITKRKATRVRFFGTEEQEIRSKVVQ